MYSSARRSLAFNNAENPKRLALVNAGIWGKTTEEPRSKESSSKFTVIEQGAQDGSLEKDSFSSPNEERAATKGSNSQVSSHSHQNLEHINPFHGLHSSSNLDPSISRSKPASLKTLRGILSKPKKSRASSQESETSSSLNSNLETNESIQTISSPISSASSVFESSTGDQILGKVSDELLTRGKKRVRFHETTKQSPELEQVSEGGVEEGEETLEGGDKKRKRTKTTRSGRISVSKSFFE